LISNYKLIFYRFLKRFEDIIFSIIVLILFSPFLIIAMFLILILDGFPIFYISNRMVGVNKEIKIIKFRTMVKDAKDEKYGLEKKYMKDGYLDIPMSSPVYTNIGRILEKTQLVEVPQIFSVLSGKISFIGNRPLPRKNIELLKIKFPDQWQKRFESRSGITGISQVVGKFKLTASERLELESLYSKVYLEGNIIKADAYIFFSTIILLLLQDATAYRSYKSAKNVLLSCLNK
jgi:lipopolysaccharide/colanic/teichoic acid biosynthesis glycosyltransferase